MCSVNTATGRRSQTPAPSSAMALILLSDDAAITDSAESAVTAPANRLAKLLLFKCSYSRDIGRMVSWDGELAKLRMLNALSVTRTCSRQSHRYGNRCEKGEKWFTTDFQSQVLGSPLPGGRAIAGCIREA